ncbi:hypothetical protein FRB94_011516 [Tulasnella sp. JGI-2019a]|nr:hypothetical protein FRB93_009792 [Tulasnella sp. JGI-2019a]KAG8992522.1 hypothetical protein FRB94_011516 [Tulasnella sp. JGI-2019a]
MGASADRVAIIQLETVLATGHEVGLVSERQERSIQEQYRISQDLLAVSQRHQNVVLLAIDRLIDRLGTGDHGASKKPPCLDGTRSAILARITRWIEEGIWQGFCLTGLAGTGKSSIAASIAKREKTCSRLGAMFHFTRDDQARNKVAILVIARQLAFWQSGRLRSAIASAIEKDPDIAQMGPKDQFEKLILEPLQFIDSTAPTLVVILDAIDECDPVYASLLLRLVGEAFGKLPSAVKFFITTRGEPWLQKYYDKDPMKSHLEIYSLEDEKQELVDKDIELFLKEELPDLVGLLVEDASDWPGEEKRKALVRKSQGLFIFASTAVRLITDPNAERDPDEEINRFLSSDYHSHLDGIYGQILERACPKTISSKVLRLFRDVIGALVVSQEPINIHTLASLICPDESQLQSFTTSIRLKVFNYLQAVLVIPGVNDIEQAVDTHPIRFIHTSFVDYLTDTARCGSSLLVHLSEQHEHLAIACFRAMESLTQNICNLDPSLLNSEVEDLSQRIQERMPLGLQYACVHIAEHISQTAAGSAAIRSLVVGFAREKLIYWLESLSLMGRTHEGVTMADSIENWFKVGFFVCIMYAMSLIVR